jgi:hypothetical protein
MPKKDRDQERQEKQENKTVPLRSRGEVNIPLRETPPPPSQDQRIHPRRPLPPVPSRGSNRGRKRGDPD